MSHLVQLCQRVYTHMALAGKMKGNVFMILVSLTIKEALRAGKDRAVPTIIDGQPVSARLTNNKDMITMLMEMYPGI